MQNYTRPAVRPAETVKPEQEPIETLEQIVETTEEPEPQQEEVKQTNDIHINRQQVSKKKRKKSGGTGFIIFLLLLLVAAIGAGAYFYFNILPIKYVTRAEYNNAVTESQGYEQQCSDLSVTNAELRQTVDEQTALLNKAKEAIKKNNESKEAERAIISEIQNAILNESENWSDTVIYNKLMDSYDILKETEELPEDLQEYYDNLTVEDFMGAYLFRTIDWSELNKHLAIDETVLDELEKDVTEVEE